MKNMNLIPMAVWFTLALLKIRVNKKYREVYLSNTERIQPQLIQMKLKTYDLNEGQRQADILARAIQHFS